MTYSEEWRPVPGFPRYEASSLGRVRSVPYVDGKGHLRKQRMITPQANHGHWTVALVRSVGAKQEKLPLGRVVLEAFGYRSNEKEIVLHGARGRDCNELSNLSFGSYTQNNGVDRRRDGTALASCGHPRTHLSEADVRQIRSMRGKMTQEEIGRLFSIDQTTVSNIQLRKSFQEVS